MSTDKEEFALYCEAKNDKVRKRLGIKGGFYWTTAKKIICCHLPLHYRNG